MTDTSNPIGRQTSGIAIGPADAAPPGPENRVAGQINGQGFQENTDNRRPPNLFDKAKQKFAAWRETRRDNAYVKSHTKHLNKISVQLPDPEATASTPGKKHEAAVKKHEARVDQELTTAIKKNDVGRFSDEKLSLDFGRKLFVRMFGKDDPNTADAVMRSLLKPENEDVLLRLHVFVGRNGSFETRSDVPNDHFGFEKETTVATISSSLLKRGDSDALVALLDANIEYTPEYEMIVGELNIKAHAKMKERKADLGRLVHKPTLDMTQPAPPLYERKVTSVHTQAGFVPAEKIEISTAYRNNPNYGAVIHRLSQASGAGMLNMHSTPPTESEVIHIAMFGGKTLPPSGNYLNGILSDPDLKAALLTFLQDGGTFSREPGENTRYAPATKTIIVGDYARDRNATRLEATLRDMFDVPMAQPPEDTPDTVADDAPADVSTTTDGAATLRTEPTHTPTEPHVAPTATTEDTEIETDAIARDVGAIDPAQDDTDLASVIGEIQDDRLTGNPQFNTLHERRMQDYQDAIDRLNRGGR